MPELEVFFDYACPYCLKGHDYLRELLPQYPDITVVWRPCEAHPRPEHYGPHSDLCIQGMYYAMEQGVDLWSYHDRMYRAALVDRVNIEDADVDAWCTQGLLNPSSMLVALHSGKYEKTVTDGNDYAYERSGVWAVPSYRMGGRKLDSVEGVGVSRRQLAEFMAK